MRVSAEQKIAIVTIVSILIVTALEFPPPIGFETRPQTGVSIYWLFFFLTILVTEIAAIPLILTRPLLGARFAIVAAMLNILQVVADQMHLMQLEVAPLEYTLLEVTVAVLSLILMYFSRHIRRPA